MQYRQKSNGNLVLLGAERLKQRAIPEIIREDKDSRLNELEVVVGVFKPLPLTGIFENYLLNGPWRGGKQREGAPLLRLSL